MELGVHDVVKNWVLTTKSLDLYRKFGKITLNVHISANKKQIKDAVEKIWNVEVKNICIMNIAGKRGRFAGKIFKSSGKKKAIVTMKSGYTISLPVQLEGMQSPSGAEAKV